MPTRITPTARIGTGSAPVEANGGDTPGGTVVVGTVVVGAVVEVVFGEAGGGEACVGVVAVERGIDDEVVLTPATAATTAIRIRTATPPIIQASRLLSAVRAGAEGRPRSSGGGMAEGPDTGHVPGRSEASLI